MGNGGLDHGGAGRHLHVRRCQRAGGRGRVVLAAGRDSPGADYVGGVRDYGAGGVHGLGASEGQVCVSGPGRGVGRRDVLHVMHGRGQTRE